MSVDIIVKSFSRDLKRLSYLLKSAEKYLTGFDNFFVVLEDDAECREFSTSYNNKFFNFYFVDSVIEGGYIYQQFVKFDGLNLSSAEYILPLDSDMVFFRHCNCSDWFFNGKPFIPYGNWVNAFDFPKPDLIAKVLRQLPSRTHDIRLICDELILNHDYYGIQITINDDEVLKFALNGKGFEVNKKRLHDTWIWSVMNLTDSPIDTMRLHYIFEKDCLGFVKKRISELTGQALIDAIFNIDVFPVFSEYQVYGNVVFNSQLGESKYIFLKDAEYYQASSCLPIVKCNSRVDSAYEAYELILNGAYNDFKSRNELLQKIRHDRAAFSSEDWG
jgi:hypothetical protein